MSRVVLGGCAISLFGLLLVAVGMIGRAIAGQQIWVVVVGGVGAVLFVVALFVSAAAGLLLNRTARKKWPTLRIGVPVRPERDAIRTIERARLSTTAQLDSFPSGLVGARRINVGPYATFLAANLPPARILRRNQRPFEPAAVYQWINLGVVLPRLVLSTDFRGQRALIGRDIDIENDDFNRRFRIDSAIPLTRRGANPQYADFARYASALWHPRAAQCVTNLPPRQMLIIEGGLLATISPPALDEQTLLRTATVLTELAGLIPAHVRRRWAHSTDYRPAR